MVEFLGGSGFLYGLIPLITVVLAVFVRIATRRSDVRRWRKEDFAVGIDLMQLATLALLTIVAARAVELERDNSGVGKAIKAGASARDLAPLQKAAQESTDHLITAVSLLVALVFSLWATSFIVQQWGWRTADDLKPVVGIALPIFLGFGSILLAIGAGR